MSLSFPAPLASWTPWLSWFSPELQTQLAPMMLRLHNWLGGVERTNAHTGHEPDGLDDLRRRGAYHRLLSSEWLLADELPDEFMRRAVSGEHLFLSPRRRAPLKGQLFVALFDAGPLQLGAPRLAHVAMWILLARRAAQADGRLLWGIQQQPGQWYESLQASDLMAMLKARSFDAAQDAHRQQWQNHIGELAAAPQEVWLLGASCDLASKHPQASTHLLGLSRSLSAQALTVDLVQAGNRRGLELALPDADVASHLLKGLFIAPPRTDVHQRIAHGVALRRPVLADNGSKAALQMLDRGGLLVVHIPTMVQSKANKFTVMQWPAGTEPLAVTYSGKRLTALHSQSSLLRVWHGPEFGLMERPDRTVFDAPPSTATCLPAALLHSGKQHQYVVLDKSGRLLRWSKAADHRERAGFERVDEQVLGLWQLDNRTILYIAKYAGWLWVRQCSIHAATSNAQPLCTADGDAVFFGGADLWRADVGVCAVRTQSTPNEHWCLNVPLGLPAARTRVAGPLGSQSMAFRAVDIALSGGWQGIGVSRADSAEHRYALLALDKERTGLHAHDGQRSTLLYTAPSRIVSTTVCPRSGVVAMLTDNREFIAFGAAECALRLIMQWGPEARV